MLSQVAAAKPVSEPEAGFFVFLVFGWSRTTKPLSVLTNRGFGI
jgi:hypothetical protein